MINARKRLTIIISFVLITVLFCTMVPHQNEIVKADSENVINVQLNGETVKSIKESELVQLANNEGAKKYNYSKYNNMGNFSKYYGVFGPSITGIISKAGIDLSSIGDNCEIVFKDVSSGRDFITTMTKKQLFEERYYFPNGSVETEKGGKGSFTSLEDKVTVPAIIGLVAERNMNDKGTLCFGQKYPSERNAPNFINRVTENGYINVTTNPAKTAASVSIKPDAQTVTWGTAINMNAGSGVIYYSVDGSIPSNESYIFNYDTKSTPKRSRDVRVPANVTSFTVKAFSTEFGKLDSEVVTKTYSVGPPVVSNVKTSVINYKTAKISWSPVAGAEGYNIYRSDSQKGAYRKIASVNGQSSMSYNNTSLKTGKKYFYKVAAYKDGVESIMSNVVSVKPILKKPAGLKAKAKKKKIIITSKKVPGANGYVIYRSTKKKKGFKKIKTVKKSKLKYTDKKIKKGKKYYYKIKAYRTINKKKVYTVFSKTVVRKAK